MKRIVGVAQGSSFGLMIDLARALEASHDAVMVGAFVSDSAAFQRISQARPEAYLQNLDLVKEWDVTHRAISRVHLRQEDRDVVTAYEHEVGEPAWHALLADRRLFHGRYSKRTQDYRPHLSETQMLAVLAETLRGFEELLAATDPDIILTFGTATLSDYIAGRLAKARGIDYLQLKATKVRNYVSLNDDMIALSSHIAKHYAARDTSRQAKAIARSYIDTVKAEGVKYEGAIRLDQRLLDFKPHRQLVKLAKAAALELRRQGNSVVRDDNHLDGFIIPALIEGIVQPWRARKLSKRLGKSFLQLADIEKLGDFGFFPLHFEPEVSMQVFGRPFQNQIELIRTLALALPSNVVLLVKEHPRSIGFRPVGYYEKILEIPNVRLADPFLPSIALVKRAKLVAIISGTIGLEAAILGKPVLAFGRPTYCALPGAIVSKVKDLWRLPQQITTLLTLAETSGDDAIECFIAAIVDGSVPIDLYANLLGKENRHREVNDLAGDETDQRSRDLERLADYTRLRIGATRPH